MPSLRSYERNRDYGSTILKRCANNSTFPQWNAATPIIATNGLHPPRLTVYARHTMTDVQIKCSFTRLAPTADQKPHPQNPNKHPEAQIMLLAEIIKRTGFRQPIVVSKQSGFITKGHGRHEAALKLAMPDIPIDYQDYATEDEELADMVADNEIAALSNRDPLALEEIRKQLEASSTADPRLAALIQKSKTKEEDPDAKALSASRSLVARFGIAPFSVIRGDDRKWLERKSLWKDLGIKSEIGRGEKLTFDSIASMPPNLLHEKNAWDKERGTESTTKEFMEAHGHKYLPKTSIFDPCLCEAMYQWFAPHPSEDRCITILDPFAGGSVRGIVAAIMGFKYIGIDLRIEQNEANRANAKEIFDVVGEPLHFPDWLTGDSQKLSEILAENTYGDVEFDMVFSCPPYGDLEKYSDDPLDLSNMSQGKFDKGYRHIIKQCKQRLKPNRFMVMVVGDYRDKKTRELVNLTGNTINAMEKAGMMNYNHMIYTTPIGSLFLRVAKPFNDSRKIGRRHQNVLCALNSNTDRGVKDDFPEIDLQHVSDALEAATKKEGNE